MKTYNLIKFRKTNQGTSINLKPIVERDRVLGQVLSEGYATQNGELALGRNQSCIYAMEGYNFRMRL
jgi:DNA-directed RNA polymerase subunit beta